mgnify:CR=1 FL=1
MPLIQLQTDLKSIKFGEGPAFDRRGGGNSNQPYITVDIPQNFEDSPSGFGIAFQGGTVTIPRGLGTINIPGATVNIPGGPNTDFLVRNGLNVATDVTKDLVRLGKYFAGPFLRGGSMSGLLFTTKQNLLSRIATRTQFSGKLNEGVYTPLTTLTQAGINAFGLHVEKQGLVPFVGPLEFNTYTDELKKKSDKGFKIIGGEEGEGNRLVQLTQLKIDNSVEFKLGEGFKQNNIARSENNILSYRGGPKSLIGIGQTRIPFATDQRNEVPLRTGINNAKKIKIGFKDDEKIQPNKFQPITEPITLLPDSGTFPLGASQVFNTVKDSVEIDISGGEIAANPQQGYYNSFNTSVYKESSPKKPSKLFLTPRADLKTYQVGNKIDFTTNDFISPLGISKKLGTVTIESGGSGLGISGIEDGTITVTNLFNIPGNSYHIGKQDGFWQMTDGVPSVYNKPNEVDPISNNKRIFDNNTFVLNTLQLQTEAILSLAIGGDRRDFRKTIIDDNNIKESSVLSLSPSYQDAQNKTIDGPTDSRINYASPGQKGNIISYTKGKINTLGKVNITDRLNALPLYKSKNVAATQEGDAGGFKNDLVKFRIAAIDTNNPTKKTYMHFRAYIDSFSDQYNANWNQQKYMGRGEPFYKYDNFQRDVNMSFTVAAQSKPEIMVMYRKLNYLASTLAPDYTEAGYMAGNLVQLTMGGWCYELPGFIRSLTIDVPQESTWEIGINDEGKFDNKVKEMPHIVKVTGLTFTPIHTFRPSIMKLTRAMSKPENNLADNNKYGNQRYIALKAGNNNYDSKVNWYT